MPPSFSRILLIGTDVASVFLFHPADLEHRRRSPSMWAYLTFSCRPEFEAGRYVGFTTGGDGGVRLRLTNERLTDAEKQRFVSSWDFRLAVRHGRIFVDGGQHLPCDDRVDATGELPEQWLDLPNGDYQVTVNAVDWRRHTPPTPDYHNQTTSGGQASYVIQFTPVADFAFIEPPPEPPRLEASQDIPATAKPRFDVYERSFAKLASLTGDLADRFPCFLHESGLPVPGFNLSCQVSTEFHEATQPPRRPFSSDPVPSRPASQKRIGQVVFASSEQTPTLGVVAKVSGADRTADGPWTMHFTALQVVTVLSIEPGEQWSTCTVRALKRPRSEPSPKLIKTLKEAFAVYVQSNTGYRAAIAHPDFESERIAALQSSESLILLLLHHIQMPEGERLALLPLSDTNRAKRLLETMKR